MHNQPTLYEEDLYEWNKLEESTKESANMNYTQEKFLENFTRIENAVKAKTLGASLEFTTQTLETLKKFKGKIKESGNINQEIIAKIDTLIKLAEEGNMNLSLKIT